MSEVNQDGSSSLKQKYTPLSPLPNAENSKHYVEALDYAVNDDRISNIAITGSYGSGKSTIIESYITQNPKKECIKISLAEFTDDEQKSDNEVSKQELERSILQQLFYQREASNFPDSRFDRIQKRDPGKIGDIAIFILVYLGIVAIILTKGGFEALFTVLPFFDEDSSKQVLFGKTAIYIIFVFMSYFVLFGILNKIKSIRNLNLKLETIGEIAIDKQEDGSILNLYFDEIRYFFSQSKVDVVFIEDLDRFKKLNIELFTKLREINLLVNSSLKASGKDFHQVNFVYALKDDLFTEDGERTKFFDFLIPVIPFVNFSNTGAKLLNGLKDHEEEIGKDFIFELSPYISEMRLVHNIINEFELYLLNLRQFVEGVDDLITKQKLFAFIVYKNVFPVDFTELNSGKGKVYTLLKTKPKILKEITTELNSHIDEFQQDTNDSKKLIHKSLGDNKLLLAAKLIDKIGANWNQVYIGNTLHQRQNTSLFQLADAIIKTPKFKVNNYGPDSSLEEEVLDYLRKEELITFLDKSKETQIEIFKIRKKIRSLRDRTLAELLGEYPEHEELLSDCLKSDSESSESMMAIDKNQLLIKLVSGGYIDDSYHHYLTYYHPSSKVSLSDWKFILHVQAKANTGEFQDYPIQNVEEVFIKLRSQDFESSASWNTALVDYLLLSNSTQAIHSLVVGFANDEASLDFIKKYFYSKHNFELLMKHLSGYWPKVWDDLTKILTEQENSEMLLKLIDDLDLNSWIELASQSAIKDAIEKDANFVETVRQVRNVDSLENLFKTIEIKFYNLNLSLPLSDKEQDFLNIIVKNDFYKMNDEMLSLIISLYCPERIDEYSTQQLSVLLEGNCDVVRRRIKADFNEYLDGIYLQLDKEQQDSEEFLLRLVHDKVIEDLPLKAKSQILEKQITRFSKIEKVQDQELWADIFDFGRVELNWENVVRYFHYREDTIDNALLALLSESSFVSELCSKKMTLRELDGMGDEFEGITKKLCIALTDSMEIPDNQYRELVKNLYFRWASYTLSKLRRNKVQILVEENRLSLSQSNLDGIIEYDEDLAFLFITSDFIRFIKELSKGELKLLNSSFLKAVLISSEFTDIQKNEVLSAISEEVLLELEIDAELSRVLLNLIRTENKQWSYEFLEGLVSSDNLTLDEKLDFLSIQLRYITNHNLLHGLLVHLGKGYKEIFTKGSSFVTVEDTPSSRRFIGALNLHGKGWIGKTRFKDSFPKDVIQIYVKKWS